MYCVWQCLAIGLLRQPRQVKATRHSGPFALRLAQRKSYSLLPVSCRNGSESQLLQASERSFAPSPVCGHAVSERLQEE